MSVLASNVNDAAMECPQIALQVARGHQLKCFSCFNIFDHNIWIFLITNIWIFKICFPCLHKEALTHKIALHEWIICQQPHREEYFNQCLMFLFIKWKYIAPLILFFSVDRGLDAQVRSDRGRVILRKGEQRLNLRAIQRPLVKSVDSFVKSFFSDHYGDRLENALAPISCPSSPSPKIPHSFLFS